jgi:hypothetical protein
MAGTNISNKDIKMRHALKKKIKQIVTEELLIEELLKEADTFPDVTDQRLLGYFLAAYRKTGNPALQVHIKSLEKKIQLSKKLAKTMPVVEAEDPMSNMLQTFEKAMTDKSILDKIVGELEGAPDDVKPKLMLMADKFIPAKVDGMEDLIAELESGEIDPEDIGANETKEVLIKQFKEFIKVTDFAIATIKKHVSGGGLKESRLIKLASLLPRG